MLRDPIACKPAVLAETDRYVAFGSEYRALVGLPGIEDARVWEPEPRPSTSGSVERCRPSTCPRRRFETSTRPFTGRLRAPRNDVGDRQSTRAARGRGGHQAPISVEVRGSVGYYCAGMNQEADITVHGSAGPGVAENMMSGRVIVKGDASQYAGATGKGGLLVIEGNASSRCGISMKGVDIVVGGNVGHMSAFMAQAETS